jgi:hypothetical protein
MPRPRCSPDAYVTYQIPSSGAMTNPSSSRAAIRAGRRAASAAYPATRLEIIRHASEHALPTASIEELDEIECGFLEDGSG